MKNVHLIPTSQPSRLFYGANAKKLMLSSTAVSFKTFERSPQHIYITSDEEIKEGDYIIELDGNEVFRSKGVMGKNDWCKKIILTTDQDLIKDGVQSIDDEFLEWFVKNPSCEYVEVEREKSIGYTEDRARVFYGKLKIIIPSEPKQETLEEIETIGDFIKKESKSGNESVGIVKGAKWQAERSYSEAIEFAEWIRIKDFQTTSKNNWIGLDMKYYTTQELFEEFKKK